MTLPESYFQWTFEVKDVVNFEGTHITINALTYEEAIKKVRGLKLPQLRSYSDVEEGIRLTAVLEIDSNTDDEFPEFEPEDKDDD